MIKPPIHTITITRFNYVYKNTTTEELDPEGHKNSFTEFDPEHRPLKEIKYDLNNRIEEMTEWRYTNNDFVEEELYYHEEQEPSERKTFVRDEQGLIQKEYKHYLDGAVDTITYLYGTGHLLTGKITVNDEGETEQRISYAYDTLGRLILEEIYDETNELRSKQLFSYNDQGNIIESVTWKTGDEQEIKTVNDYDQTGQLIKTCLYGEAGELLGNAEYELDETGKVSVIKEENQEQTTWTQLTYNEKGLLVLEEELINGETVLRRIERFYDTENRILEAEVFINGLERTIDRHYRLRYEYTYYPSE